LFRRHKLIQPIRLTRLYEDVVRKYSFTSLDGVNEDNILTSCCTSSFSVFELHRILKRKETNCLANTMHLSICFSYVSLPLMRRIFVTIVVIIQEE
jgi:hypothetical protein